MTKKAKRENLATQRPVGLGVPALMQRKGISPIDLARGTGLPLATVYRYANGTAARIDLRSMSILLAFFECQVSDLIVE